MTESTHDQSSVVSPTRTKRAVIYLRTASRHPADQAAVEDQRAACQALAERYGLSIVGEYVDLGRPGRTRQRPGLQGLLADLEQGSQVGYILVDRPHRLSRDWAQYGELLAALVSSGTEILSAGDADSSFSQNRVVSAIQLAHAARYVRDHQRSHQS